jgi:NodT family efflux transporter outer membrane factor (OMF) lipoprotein
MQLNKHQQFIKAPLFLLFIILLVVSCKTTEQVTREMLIPQDDKFRDIASDDSTTIADIPWDSLFTDTHLQSLINEALKNSPDMTVATARMNKARSTLRQSRLALLPSLGLNADGSFVNQNSDGSGVIENYELYGSSTWEIDIWGKLRSTSRANMNAFMQSESYKRAVQTTLVADVATWYYTLLALDSQLQITEQTVKNREADVETMKIMKESDLVTGADLVQSQASTYSAEVTVPDILVGRIPGPVERGVLAEQQISANLKTGIPAQLLSNRPDVVEAEYQVRYSFEMVNVARTYFYPSLNITASGGITGTDLSTFFNPASVFWNVVGNVAQPLFNKGTNRQRLESAKADRDEALAVYKQTLLSACSEVANAMHDYQSAEQKVLIREQQIQYLEKAVDYTMELLKYTSSTNYTDVLTSENNLLSARLDAVNDRLQQLEV